MDPTETEKSKIERRTFALVSPAEVRQSEDGDTRRIEGHAAVFGEWTQIGSESWGWRERIDAHAFDEAITDDVRALFNHDPSLLLGRTASGTLRLSIDGKGLGYSVDPPDTSAGRDILELVSRGDVSQSSFAFEVLEERWEFFEDEPDSRTILKVRLYDVSPVTYPAYEGTDVALRSVPAGRDEARMAWAAKRRSRLEARMTLLDLERGCM